MLVLSSKMLSNTTKIAMNLKVHIAVNIAANPFIFLLQIVLMMYAKNELNTYDHLKE